MLVSDYPDGIITNFTWTVIRMTIANTIDTSLDYQDQIYSAAVFLSLCLCIYIKNVHLRKAYMFSIRDSQWEVLLPQLISKPTFIFTCNEEKQQFQISRMIQMHFLMNVENPLLHFLRNSRVGSKTLEQYIWDRTKQRKNTSIRYTMENLSIHYNKKQQSITFSECLLDTVTFILVIDSEDKNFIELRKKQYSIQEQHTNQILKVFKSQQNIIKRGLKEKNFELIFDLSIALVQMIQRCQLNKICLRLVNLTNLIDYIIKLFQSQERTEYDFKCKQNILLLTIQPLLISYLLYLFQNTRQFNHIIIELSRINGQVQLQILGQLQKQIDSFYEQAEKILIKKKILIQPCNQVYFYIDTILIFNESPMLSFNSTLISQKYI
ncbi:unnamed protein product [Paramecium sonneborni]|uniref:Uncharacterized protein n=1 Tax=Paramecium sonneborni TaxID=65129 RepID=A0A8S1P3U5_9CILI|nr:unnamed protein product [Paramecium sonneborni]